MKASLFFAEIQSAHYGLTENIKNSSEENRATLAEYVNKSIDKNNRPRDYTADDIANDTDGIATQLGIMQFASPTFINYADAISSLEADQAQESAIGDVVGAMQDNNLGAEGKRSFEGYAEDGRGMYKSNFPKGTPKTAKSKVILDYIQNVWSKNPITLKINENGQTREVVAQFDPTYDESGHTRSDATKLMGGNRHGTASEQRVTLDLADDYYQIASEAQYNYSKDETGKDTSTHEGVRKWHYFVNDIYFSEFDSEEYKPYQVSINVKEKDDGSFVYSFSAEEQRELSTPQTLHAVVNGDKVTANAQPSANIIHQNKPTVKSKSKKNSKRDLASNPSQKSAEKADKTVESKVQEKSAERKNEADKPVIRKPKEALTDKQRAERAVKRAEKLIEWEKKTQPSTKELNTAREYIKDFDSLPPSMRTSVIKMLRSADGKIDKNTLKGVANLMTMRRRDGRLVMPDLEFRFAEGIGDGGLYTHIGEGENKRVLILINSDTDFKDTIRGTIAHEVVHYIENRKGYRELADYVLKTAKKEKIAEIEGEYNEHYKGIYTAEAEEAGLTGEAITKKVAERMATEDYKDLIESEVVAKLIGLRLNNEKFLKKYATKDDAMIKKIFRFLRATVSYLKDKDKATADEVTKLVNMFDEVIKGNVISDGGDVTKTAKSDETNLKVKAFSKVAVSTALYDALDHKDSGYDNLILMSKMPRFIEDKFGISGDLYVYRDHLYENTVSKERATAEGRPTTIGKKDRHFHNLGEERMIEAIMAIDSPIISVEVHSKDNNPTVIMALPVLDDNGFPLRAVLSFYSDRNINGSFDRKPHIVLTITPSQMSESSGARKGWAEFISEAVEDGRVLSYDKEKGSVLSVIAQQARLGNITEASLNDSISRFKRFVNEFKQKNKINYDLVSKKTVTRTNSEKMQVTGKRDLAPKKNQPAKTKAEQEVNRGNDVYFERAVAESYKKEAESAKRSKEAYKEGNKRLNKKLNESRSKTAKLKSENRSLAQQIARDAYETDAKTFTQKEIDALVERINQYSTDKFKDIMDEKKATISKIDKEDLILVGFNFILRPRQA